jgi:hypothetical protein
MGKRFDALRVAFARPKRTNWKALYAADAEAFASQTERFEQKQDLIDRQHKLAVVQNKEIKRLTEEMLKYKAAYEKLEDKAKIADPFRPKDNTISFTKGSHPFYSGYFGNAWKCKNCGKGTRDLRHKGHAPIAAPTKEASEVALAIAESLPGWSASSRTPSERSTDGFYVSERSLNYKGRNASKRRAYVHVFTCPKITARRSDDTVIVQGDGEAKTISGWLWGADMTQIRALAKAKAKYTKLCECISGETNDADNSNGQIGSMITSERTDASS